jgi:hypothetical protein
VLGDLGERPGIPEPRSWSRAKIAKGAKENGFIFQGNPEDYLGVLGDLGERPGIPEPRSWSRAKIAKGAKENGP